MFKKRAVVISTTAGIGAKEAIKPVVRTLFYWGISDVRQYGIAVQAMNWDGVSDKKKEKIRKSMAKLAKKLSKSSTPYVSLRTKLMFNMMRNMYKANMGSGTAERYNSWLSELIRLGLL